ncbi:hypothetical protein D915_009374, partial [Fasciola hepatica]
QIRIHIRENALNCNPKPERPLINSIPITLLLLQVISLPTHLRYFALNLTLHHRVLLEQMKSDDSCNLVESDKVQLTTSQ